MYAVERPTRALVQSDDCVNLPDDVDDNLDDALARSDRDFDDDTVRNLKESINDLDRDAQDSAIELVEATDGGGVDFLVEAGQDTVDVALADEFPTVKFVDKVEGLSDAKRRGVINDIEDGTIPLGRLSENSGLDDLEFDFEGDQLARIRGTYSATDTDIESNVIYARDSEEVLRKYDDTHDNPADEFRSRTPQQRGEYIEKHIAPDVLREQYGYRILCKGDGCSPTASGDGADIIAWDPDGGQDGNGKLVVIESKWTGRTTDDKPNGPNILGDGRQVSDEDGGRCIQMSHCWVEDSLSELDRDHLAEMDSEAAEGIWNKYGPDQRDYDDNRKGEQLQQALQRATEDQNGYRSELFITRPHRSGSTIDDKTSNRRGGRIREKDVGEDMSTYIDQSHHLKIGQEVVDDE